MNEGEVSGRLGLPAGRRSPRRRSSPATCCWPSTSARRLHVCHVSTAGSVEILRWAKAAGHRRHRRGHPAPPAAHRRPGRELRPGLQGQPAAAHRPRTSRRCAPAWSTARSTSSPPTTPRTPREDKDCEWALRPAGHARPGDRAVDRGRHARSDELDWDGIARADVARAGPDRRPDRPRPPTRRRAARPTSPWSTRPPAGWSSPAALASRSRNTPYAGMRLPAGSSPPSCAASRPSSTERLSGDTAA